MGRGGNILGDKSSPEKEALWDVTYRRRQTSSVARQGVTLP